jgi:hypothetical protein
MASAWKDNAIDFADRILDAKALLVRMGLVGALRLAIGRIDTLHGYIRLTGRRFTASWHRLLCTMVLIGLVCRNRYGNQGNNNNEEPHIRSSEFHSADKRRLRSDSQVYESDANYCLVEINRIETAQQA